MIRRSLTICSQCLHHLHNRSCERQLCADAVRSIQRIRQIAFAEINKARLEVAVHHHRRFGIQHGTARQYRELPDKPGPG